MSPREVEGLQKLAVANGTSLTINPQTGLPEAFSLQDLLPTLIGGAATYFTGGAITPLMAALGTGAVTALTSKDLGKGLMAGLGAYGGAGIVSGLAGFGTGALSAEAGAAATQAAGAATSPLESEILSQAAIAPKLAGASYADKFGAGLSKAMSDPMGAASAIGGGSKIAGLAKVAGALSPLLAGETGNTVQTVTKRPLPRPRQPSVYDNMSQTFERYAANGGLMGLAHGGAVRYADGGFTASSTYDPNANFMASTGPDERMLAYINERFGTNNTATNNTATNTAATNTANTGGGFAATAEEAAAPVTTTAASVAAPAAVNAGQNLSFTGNTAANNTGIATLLPSAPVAETAPMALNNALINMGAGKGMSVQDAAMKVLGRQLSPTELSNWNASIGSDDVTAAELSKFSIAAQPERALGINNTNNAIREMYLERLGRYPDASGLAYFSNKFGDKVEPEERAIFNAMTTEEFEANVARDKKNLPTVVTDLTTAATNYIAPGVGGSTSAGQIGGGTTINPNGTITTSPRIPGIPVGGFSGMTDVKRTYTDSGGSLGYTSYAPETIDEFNKKYTNTGSQKEMYDYLMGKGDKPTKTKNKDGTFREVSRSYNEAVLGVPGSTNAKRIWNPLKGEYFRNPDYMRQRTIRDPDTKAKSTINYMSINQAKAALAKTPLEGNALAYWSIENFVDPETLAEATGMNQNQITKLLADAKADKAYVKKAGGGLLSLANGGLAGVGYADGGLPDKEFTNSVTGVKYYFDFDNGIYRPETSVKDGITYKWNPVTNKYETGGSNASGIAGLMDMSGGSNAGDARGPGTGTTTPIENNGFFSSILGRTTQPAAPVESRTENTPQQNFRASELNAQNAKNIADMNRQTHIDLTTEYERELKAADDANKTDQAQRDAITSANSPTATGGRANSPYAGVLGVNLNAGELSNRDPVTTTLSDRISALADRARASQAVRAAYDRDAIDLANAQADADANREASTSSSGPAGGDYSPGTEGSASRDSNTAEGEANGGMIGRYAQGGLGSLGGYSDGGRLLRGPGDGVSDSIPASIGDRQPARLADGEFVVPARIVSELGNGSTEAGARALYKMMARIQANRRKTTGKNSVAVDSKAHKYLPA
jgi:hypothetical protein